VHQQTERFIHRHQLLIPVQDWQGVIDIHRRRIP
jgi:hypothetical protein